MNRDGNKAILTIKDVHDDDAGDITCELSNRRGKETATAKLKVQSKYIVSLCFHLFSEINRLTHLPHFSSMSYVGQAAA